MNSDEIIKLLDDLAERFGVAIDWSSKEVLPYLEDLMGRCANYLIAQNVICVIVGITLVLAGVFLVKRSGGSFQSLDDGWLIVFCVVTFFGTFLLLGAINDIFQVIFLPEVAVYRYMVKLL